VEILLPNGPTYTPGVKQHLMVRVSDPDQKRWGFELTARLNSDLANGQAGDFNPTDNFTQVICDNGASKPCPTASSRVQFIEHTVDGTRLGTSSGATFEFDWTPPTTDSGPVTLYAAGNAANGNGSFTGDHIYTANVQLAVAGSGSTSQKPLITNNGVVNAASFQPVIAPNSWITILGSNLAGSARLWRADEIQNGKLPTSLDNVSVTVNGKAASVEYISPTQLNALAPDDTASGLVPVQVTTSSGTSDPVMVQMQQPSPGFFLYDGKYLAATHADSKAIGKAGLFPAFPNLTTPAKPGEIVIMYATGCGATSPVMPSGQLATDVAPLVNQPKISIGGLPATVQFAGMIPGYAGLFQFNVEVPAAIGDGDQAVVAELNGISSPSSSSCCFITVQH
jgi:uncharacterized protein (TIGR03437 family)